MFLDLRFIASPLRSQGSGQAGEILHLLRRLDQFIRLDDVQFGKDPPDFVFGCQGKQIGGADRPEPQGI